MASYIGIIHKDKNSDFGVSFPDFLGCITSGSTVEEAYLMAREALQGHINFMHADGDSIPRPMSFIKARAKGLADDLAMMFMVEVSVPSVARRINATIEEDVLKRIDRVSPNRSKFLTEAARHELERRGA